MTLLPAVFCLFVTPRAAFAGESRQEASDIASGPGLVLKIRPKADGVRMYAHCMPYYSATAEIANGWDWCFTTLLRPRIVELGAIKPESGGELRLEGITSDWSAATARYSATSWDGQTAALAITAGRLSPGVMVETELDTLVLQGAANIPCRGFAAFQTQNRVAVCPLPAATPDLSVSVQSRTVNLEELQDGWLLLWWGRDISEKTSRGFEGGVETGFGKGDVPLLFVFQNPPYAITAAEDAGLCLQFADSAGHMVILPPFGAAHPLAEETARWSKALPEQVAKRCAHWARDTGAYPASARESYSYDRDRDEARIMEHIAFTEVREGAEKLAPLPPMLALACHYKFPVEIIAKNGPAVVRDLATFTPYGPYAVVAADSYEIRIRGMGKYALERRVAGPAPQSLPAGCQRIAARLDEEIDAMLQAGHLAPTGPVGKYAPSYATYGWQTVEHWFGKPAETLYALANVLQLMPEAQQSEIRDYMKKEREDWPPEIVARLPGDKGARREPWPMNQLTVDDADMWKDKNMFLKYNMIQPENIYALAEYYLAMGRDKFMSDPADDILEAAEKIMSRYAELSDWASLGLRDPGWARNSFIAQDPYILNRTWGLNRLISGLIGHTRLLMLADKREEAGRAMALLAKALAGRYAAGRYAEYLYERDILPLPPGTTPMQDIRPLIVTDEGVTLHEASGYYGLTGSPTYHGPYQGMKPELLRFTADYLKPQAEAYAKEIAFFFPEWFARFGGPASNTGESPANVPTDSQQVFNVLAQALGHSGDELLKYVDCPWWRKGDLYLVEKLTETLIAYRGAKWVKIEL